MDPILPDHVLQRRHERRAEARARERRRRLRRLRQVAIAAFVAGLAALGLLAASLGGGDGEHQASAAGPGGLGAHAVRMPVRYGLRPPPPGLHVVVNLLRPPRSGLLFNLDNGEMLWSRHPRAVVPIASLTKMMTALLVVGHASPDEPVLVEHAAMAYKGSGIGLLKLGMRVGVETMLYGLLLPSGNDAAIALAQHVSGTVPRFVALMNREARLLHLTCTHYVAPDGFIDRDNHSCAADLAVLAHEMLRQPRLASIIRSRSAVRPFPIKGGKLYLYNNNPLLRLDYPGTIGVKTGYTQLAGHCLVAAAERHGIRLGVVLLNTPAPPGTGPQAETLLDAGFRAYGV